MCAVSCTRVFESIIIMRVQVVVTCFPGNLKTLADMWIVCFESDSCGELVLLQNIDQAF